MSRRRRVRLPSQEGHGHRMVAPEGSRGPGCRRNVKVLSPTGHRHIGSGASRDVSRETLGRWRRGRGGNEASMVEPGTVVEKCGGYGGASGSQLFGDAVPPASRPSAGGLRAATTSLRGAADSRRRDGQRRRPGGGAGGVGGPRTSVLPFPRSGAASRRCFLAGRQRRAKRLGLAGPSARLASLSEWEPGANPGGGRRKPRTFRASGAKLRASGNGLGPFAERYVSRRVALA